MRICSPLNLRGSLFRRTVVACGPQKIKRFENFDADGGMAIYLSDKVRRKLRFMVGEEITGKPIFPMQ